MPFDDLSSAVRRLVHDGDSVALEGFTHPIPYAAGHETIRRERRELTLIRMTACNLARLSHAAGICRS